MSSLGTLVRRGLLGGLLERYGHWMLERLASGFTVWKAVGAFLLVAFLLGRADAALKDHRRGILTERRYDISATAERRFRHPTLRIAASGNRAEFKSRRGRVSRSRWAYVSGADLLWDHALRGTTAIARILLVLVPLISIVLWFRRGKRDAERDYSYETRPTPRVEDAARRTPRSVTPKAPTVTRVGSFLPRPLRRGSIFAWPRG